MSKTDSHTPRERAELLLSQMTLEEKIQQMVGVMSATLLGADGPSVDAMTKHLSTGIGHIAGAPALGHQRPAEIARASNTLQRFLRDNTRLGIPAIIHSEALNGATLPRHPIFPTPIALAATWKPDSVREMATLISEQLRAVGISQALAPVMDVARDARWGRVHETFGEDPYLVSAMSVAMTAGLQGNDLRHSVIATAKHFLGYAAGEAGQNTAASRISDRELYEVYARPFEAAIRMAGLGSVMNSYSEFDHEPIVASARILRELLRERMQFDGTVISDYASVKNLVDIQYVADGPLQAGIASLEGGLDVELPVSYGYGAELVDAVKAGTYDVRLIDEAVTRILRDKFALGLFDDPFVREEVLVDESAVHTGDALALELASDSITLLKNEDATLPLSRQLPRIAIIGPHATDTDFAFPAYTYPASVNMMRAMMMGESTNMAGIDAAADMIGPEVAAAIGMAMAPLLAVSPDDFVRTEYGSKSLAEAVAELAPGVELATLQTGVLDNEPTDLAEAVRLAASAEVTIVALGGRPGWFGTNLTEGEASDSADISLPAGQVELVKAIAATGTKVVAVVFSGRPFGLAEIVDEVAALVYAYYGGQRAGQAIAAALFGDVNPGGKLPYSLPRHSGQVPIYAGQHNGTGYRKDASNLNLGYLDMPGTPLFHFGHGLSYTAFEYSELEVATPEVPISGSVSLSVNVTNSGPVSGDEVVQLYFHDVATGVTRPAQELVGFRRLRLEAGESARLEFVVPVSQLGYLAKDNRFIIEPGLVDASVGSSSDDIRSTISFDIVGETRELGTLARAFVSECRVQAGE